VKRLNKWCRFGFWSAVLLLGGPTRRCDAQAPSPRAANPERPTVATHAYTVAPRYWELEQGFRVLGVEELSEVSSYDFNLKIGLARTLQLGVFGAAWIRNNDGSGIGDVGLSLKWKRALGDRAALALVPAITVPTGDEVRERGAGRVLGSFVGVYSADLAEPLHIDVNAGPIALGAERPLWFTSLGASGSLGDVGWALELFDFRRKGGGETGLLGAVLFSLAEWVVLDVGGVLGVGNQSADQLFIGATTNVGRVF
jgi:hypothetical protein